MAWGWFGKSVAEGLTKGAAKIWRNSVELPLRIAEVGEKIGVVNSGLIDVVDNVLYKPLRQLTDPKGEIVNKPEYTRKKLIY